MIDQLAVARVRRENDNDNVSPVDLLQAIIADIQEGEIQADGLIVICVDRPDSGEWNTHRYRCGMTRTDELAFLELAKHAFIENWRDD